MKIPITKTKMIWIKLPFKKSFWLIIPDMFVKCEHTSLAFFASTPFKNWYTCEDCGKTIKKCAHPNAEVTPPCCTVGDPDIGGLIACGCQGAYSVYCPDCKELSNEEMDEIIEKYLN